MISGNQAQSMGSAFSCWPESNLEGFRLPKLTKHIYYVVVKSMISAIYVMLITILFVCVSIYATNWKIIPGAKG